MAEKIRTLDFYGYDEDCTMVKDNENYENECFQISKAKEIRNQKYVKEDE